MEILLMMFSNPFFIAILALAIPATWRAVRKWRRRTRTILAETPLLLSEFREGSANIVASPSGSTPHGLHVLFYGAFNMSSTSQRIRGIHVVELPFTSKVHLVGIPIGNETPVELGQANGLERIALEGNYNQVFHLFAERYQQMQSRYVLDPAAMEFTVDFCRQFNWEILNDMMYFMDQDDFPNRELIDQFVEQIRPAIQAPSDRHNNIYKMSYTHLAQHVLHCPICNEQLTKGEAWLQCPKGHGCLLTGNQLYKMSQRTTPLPQEELQPISHTILKCPYCKHTMEPTRYQQTNTTIDVCSHCMFRWLDTGEPAKLFGGKNLAEYW